MDRGMLCGLPAIEGIPFLATYYVQVQGGGEGLFAYTAGASHAVSLVLIRVDDEVQRSIYYVSKSLHKAEVHYLPLEKTNLAIVHATQKLPHYF